MRRTSGIAGPLARLIADCIILDDGARLSGEQFLSAFLRS